MSGKKVAPKVRVPKLRVYVGGDSDGSETESYCDSILEVSGSKYELAEKLRWLANLVGSSTNLLEEGTVILMCRRKS